MRLLFLMALMGVQLIAQTPIATYYAGINTSSATFITDLESRIRSPYTRITYDNFDETNIAHFEAQSNGSGGYYVTCVYSGYQYNYTGTFTWEILSREHTWCYSWMPTYNSTSGEEYSDQHHLFPTHQDNANGRRSNHPLGVVTTISYQFLDGKLGTNALGQTVYEPRDQQKGDAARALLYMALRYDDVNGYNWDFNWLNTVRLPSLSEAPQNLDLLLQWHQNDPPDAWEIARNDYIESIQGNRNPFVDHPEYVNYINFSDMSYAGSLSLSVEPTNYVTNFATSNVTSNAIQLNWTDALTGSQAPSGYLIMTSTNASITAPTDGVVYTNDLDLSDGIGKVNVDYSAANSYTFTNLSGNTRYYYKIFSYNGTGSSINYKTDGTVPSANDLTSVSTGSSTLTAGDILIIGFNMTDPDEFAFVPLVDLAGGVVINFTDNGWFSSGSLRTGEGFIIWTAPAGGVTHGTIINVTTTTTSTGTVSSSGSFALSASGGDQILAYTGSASSPNFLYAVNDDSTAWNQTAYSSNSSALPTGLTEGISAIALNEIDNAIYSGTISSDYAQLRLDVGTKTNWSGSDVTRQTMPTGQWALPVELESFRGESNSGSVQLIWRTATEINNYGFEIERSIRNEELGIRNWTNIGFVNGAGNSNSPIDYSFTDKSGTEGNYFYRLKQIDNDGKFKYSHEVEVDASKPSGYLLEQNYPNPFNPATTIQFSLPVDAKVSINLYDMLGREAAVLTEGIYAAGMHRIVFDAAGLSSGVYVYRLNATPAGQAAYRLNRLMTILK
ncbi:MAG: endonuclease [Ignavibacteria bacterium]|nr:endonuclease [Ignavibacteria bacterium]